MKFSFTLTSNTNPKKIWEFYKDVKKWLIWEEELESISLDDEFKKNVIGKMKFKNTPVMNFELVSIKEFEEFTNKTIIPKVGEILFSHELQKTNDKLLITHSVEFISFNGTENENFLKLISNIFSTVPKSVFSLIEKTNE